MRLRVVDRMCGLSGNDLQFEKEDFFGLKPGAAVIQIGDGRENGCVRTSEFEYPVIYKGSIMVDFGNDIRKMYAFFVKKMNGEDVYFIYGSTGMEIYNENITNLKTGAFVCRWYKPQFTTIKN